MIAFNPLQLLQKHPSICPDNTEYFPTGTPKKSSETAIFPFDRREVFEIGAFLKPSSTSHRPYLALMLRQPLGRRSW